MNNYIPQFFPVRSANTSNAAVAREGFPQSDVTIQQVFADFAEFDSSVDIQVGDLVLVRDHNSPPVPCIFRVDRTRVDESRIAAAWTFMGVYEDD